MMMAMRTSLPRTPMSIFVAGTYVCILFGLPASAFVRAPGVSTFHQRKPPAQLSILLQHGGGLQGGPAQESTASNTERAMRLDNEHGDSEGGSSEGTNYELQIERGRVECGCRSTSFLCWMSCVRFTRNAMYLYQGLWVLATGMDLRIFMCTSRYLVLTHDRSCRWSLYRKCRYRMPACTRSTLLSGVVVFKAPYTCTHTVGLSRSELCCCCYIDCVFTSHSVSLRFAYSGDVRT